MRKVLVYSVPGTGTRFTISVLQDVFGYKVENVDRLPWIVQKNRFCQVHTGFSPLDTLAASVKQLRVICPLRHPYESFITRTYKLGWSPSAPRIQMPRFAQYWQHMIKESEALNAMFLPVDAGFDRRELLQSIANHIQADPDEDALEEYVEKWPKVGARGDSPIKREYRDHGTVLGKKLKFLDFAVDWYDQQTILSC